MPFIERLMSRFFHRKSMQYQLITTYLIVNIVPIIVVGMLAYRVSADSITREAQHSNVLLLEAISRNLNAYLQEIDHQSEIFASLLTAGERTGFIGNKQIDAYLAKKINTGDEYLSIRIFSDSGQLLRISVNPSTFKAAYDSPEEIAWQRRMRDNRQNELIFDLHPLEVNGLYSFTASKAFFDPDTGKRIGYISYDKKLFSFTANFRQIEYQSGGVMEIIKEDGKLLYHTDNAKIGKPAEAGILNSLQRISADTYLEQRNGQKFIVTYNKLTGGNLAVVGSVPLSVLTKEIGNLRNITLIASCISVLLVFILTFFLSIYMTKPIKRLIAAMSKLERGDFNVQTEMNANLEITHLNNSFRSMVDTINDLINKQYETELHKKDAELKALIMQINPHFLYNTLEVINGIADMEGVHQISEITQALSKMLRYNIDLKKEEVRVADEIENVRHYVLILKSRFEDHLTVEWDIDPEAGPYLMVKMVLQPLVENAIKHGIERKLGKGLIRLSVRKLDNEIEFRLEDNGTGFDPAKLEEFRRFQVQSPQSFHQVGSAKHLGLKNVYLRLRLVFGERLHFHIDSVQGEGTVITIRIPAITQKPGNEEAV